MVGRMIGRRTVLAGGAAGLLGAALPQAAQAEEKIAVGVLRFVSSGGLFLATARGYFRQEGLDIDLKFFQAAQPIAVAVVSGDTRFGVTALTAGFYNLAGKGALKIIGGQAREKKGFEGNAILVSNEAWAKGFDSLKKFPGHSLAITQAGSSFHYQIGQIAKAEGFDLKSVALKPLQSLPNMVAAVKSGQADALIIAPHIAKGLVAAGAAKLLGWYSDIDEYQFGALFAGTKTVEQDKPLVQKFVRAYQKGAADYAAAFLRKDAAGKRIFDDAAHKAAAEIAQYVYPGEAAATAVPKVEQATIYVDPKAHLDIADIAKQIAWMQEQGLVEPGVEAKAICDLGFLG